MKTFKWWPLGGRPKEEILQTLCGALSENIDYAKDLVIGFPGTTPAQIGVEAFQMFLPKHPNNICTHTSGIGEVGFNGTQKLEREAIFMMADLLGAQSVDGYITPGGTESNIMGLLLGREYLASAIPTDKRCVVLTSIFSHYSVRKAAWVLGIGHDYWQLCPFCSKMFGEEVHHIYEPCRFGSGVDLLGTDRAGRLLIEQLEERVAHHYYKGGIRRFIVVATEGNIITGGVDDVSQIGKTITEMRCQMFDARFYLHVDACFGGFVVPFLDNLQYPFSFHVPEVDSVAVDPHKMGEVPYPTGMFIYRRDARKFRELLGIKMGYVFGETDGTLCGSRPGAAAAACYAVFQERGYEGYKQVVARCMENVAYLARELGSISDIEVLPHDLNIVPFRLKGPASHELSEDFASQVKLVRHRFPEDFSNPNDHVRKIYKATVMSHVKKEVIDRFVDLLKKQLSRPRQ